MDYEGFEAGSPVTNQSFRAAPWMAPTEGVGYTCVFTVPFLSTGEGRGESQRSTLGLRGPCVSPGNTGCYLAGQQSSGSDPCSTHASRSTQALAQSPTFNPAQPSLD